MRPPGRSASRPRAGLSRCWPRTRADAALADRPDFAIHRLTLDSRLQTTLESLLAERVAALGQALSGAVVVIDNATGEVRARVGSPGLLLRENRGALDMTAALRSPGSALKPFIYALAFEAGLAHPETLVDDRPSRWGAYQPDNFDGGFQGTLTARRALQMSLNLPAVELLSAVGPARLLARLRGAGAGLAVPPEAAPGLAIGLGGVGITLVDLTRLYAGLASAGTAPALVTRFETRPASAPRRSRHGPGGGLVRGGHPARRAAARQRRRGPDRLQDWHLLRLQGRLGGRLRPALHGRNLGSVGRTERRCPGSLAGSRRRRSCSTPSRGSAASRSP
jgi:hypothetical protein